MLWMIEKAKRGGISQVCSKRYAQANDKYLPNYDVKKDSSYLMYYDANNLYGWAVSQSLPDGNLRCVKEKNSEKILQDIVISSQKELDEAKVGHYFEVIYNILKNSIRNNKTFQMHLITKVLRRKG